MAKQNIFDNETFFEGYKAIRDREGNANDLFEIPALFSLLPVEDIEMVDGKFDIVISSLAFHYVEDFDGTVKKSMLICPTMQGKVSASLSGLLRE